MYNLKPKLKKWKVSRYTHNIGVDDCIGILHNSCTGAILEFSSGAYKKVCNIFEQLNNGPKTTEEVEPQNLFSHLIAGGFVVEANNDELGIIEKEYESKRNKSRFLFTIFPTFDCNLSCDYCFVEKKSGTMKHEVMKQIVDFTSSYLENHSIPDMTVDWLGGEPLIALDIICSLSSQFQQICNTFKIPYQAQVITNGTLLNDNVVYLLQESGVERLQITIDGPPDVHDQRRGFKSGCDSSFATIMSGIEKAIGKFIIRLRINIDSRNLNHVWSLLDLFEQKGWLGPETGFLPYLARLSPFTESCGHIATRTCEMDYFYENQFKWWKQLEKTGVPVALQPLYQFPERRFYNCGAVGMNGFVFTPKGDVHKCGLTINDSSQSIGQVGRALDINNPNYQQWLNYSPFKNPTCRECSFLPTCLGGCPRNQIKNRKLQIIENCKYYKQFENQILQYHLKLNRS